MRLSTLLTTFAHILAGFATAQTPPGFIPASSDLLPVSFANIPLKPGQHLPLNATSSAPTLVFPSPSSLILMLDLDTPYASLNRSYAPFLHFIFVPSSFNSNGTIIQYAAPAPPPGSPDHRYVILDFERAGNTTGTFTMPKGFEDVGITLMSKANFDLDGFVRGAALVGPKRANWFTVSAAGGNGTSSQPVPSKGGAGSIWGSDVLVTSVFSLIVFAGWLL